jgi:hypothetical protein
MTPSLKFSIKTTATIAKRTNLLKRPSKSNATLNLFFFDIVSYTHKNTTTNTNRDRNKVLCIKYKKHIFYKILNNYMIEIPTKTNFYEMSFLQIIIVILKFIIYFDYNEIEELAGQLSHPEQIGGAALAPAAVSAVVSAVAPSVITATKTAATTAAKNAVSGATETAAKNAVSGATETAAKTAVAGGPAEAPPAEAPVAGGPGGLAGLAGGPGGLAGLAGGPGGLAGLAGGPGGLAGLAGGPGGLAGLAGGPGGLAGLAGAVPGGDLAAAAAGGLSELDKGLNTNLSNDKDLNGIKKGFINNNWIMEITKQAMDIFSRIAKTVGEIVSRLFMVFIFAATFPALPFFAVMGLVYAFAKYGAFKFRGL